MLKRIFEIGNASLLHVSKITTHDKTICDKIGVSVLSRVEDQCFLFANDSMGNLTHHGHNFNS